MKAKRASRCTVCTDRIEVGDEIGAFLGKWVHEACKAADIARRAKAGGAAVEIPQAIFGNETITYVGTRCRPRKGLHFLKAQDRL